MLFAEATEILLATPPPQGTSPWVYTAVVLAIGQLLTGLGWVAREWSQRSAALIKAKADTDAAKEQTKASASLAEIHAESAHTQLEYDAIKNLIAVQTEDGKQMRQDSKELRSECQLLRDECAKLRESNRDLLMSSAATLLLNQKLLDENAGLKGEVDKLAARINAQDSHIKEQDGRIASLKEEVRKLEAFNKDQVCQKL